MDFTETAVIRIGAKQVDRQYHLAHIDCILGALASALLFGITWIYAAQPIIVALSAAPLVISICRWLLALIYNRSSPPSSAVRRWQTLFNIGALTNAIAWGAAASLIVLSGERSAGTLAASVTIIVSLSTVILYAGAAKTTAAFAILSLAPPAIVAAIQSTPSAFLICGVLIVCLIIAIGGSILVKRLVWDAVITTTENEQLVGHLDQRRTQVEKLNIALKTNADKREQAEITLRRTAADLGFVQGKARALADTLERVSPMCQVTGLSNRRNFDQQFESEWRRATRDKKPISLVIVEIDEYPEYLEAYGSQSSDGLLKRVGHTVKGFGRRAGDLAGRYEDGKLAIMLPGCDALDAVRIAEALRKRVESIKVVHAGAKNRDTVTIHLGVATIKPALSLPSTELQKRSDAALYEARFQGGNKVVAYKPLSKLKLERWDKVNDGPLSEQTMLQKLLVWGYDTAKSMLRNNEKPREHVSEHDTVIAALAGELLVNVEGHTMAIKGGDSIFVPRGVALLLQARGDNPVVIFIATKE